MERVGQFAEEDQFPLIDLDEVRPGDLVFTARDGALQWLCEVAGDPWRHSGIANEIDGTMCIMEVGGELFSYRPLGEVFPQQSAVGLARVSPELQDCAVRAANWARSMLEERQVYAWDDMVMAGLILATRKRLQIRSFDRVVAAINHAEQRVRTSGRPSMTCSGFIYDAFRQAGTACRLNIEIEPLWSHPVATRSGALRPIPLDELSILSLPIQAAQLESRSLYELSGFSTPTRRPNRSGGGGHMSGPQFASTVRSLVHLVAGYGAGDVVPPQLPMDGRWITPGDLWRLPSHELRGFLKAPEWVASTRR